jgi:hypothetical protein
MRETSDQMTSPPSPTIAAIPDSADARLLVDLTSLATDLSEAAHTLGLALAAGEDSDLWSPLTMHAVTAYCRPFVLSNVRDRLDEMLQFSGVPTELRSVHDRIRKYRNTTVAHSRSDLALPIALARLDDSVAVRDVVGVTVLQPMTLVVAERFAELVDAVQGLVEDATKPVAERLKKHLADVPPNIVAGWPMPEAGAAQDYEFSGGRARTRRPQFTAYWRMEPPHPSADDSAD